MTPQIRLAAIAATQAAAFHRNQAYGVGYTRWMVETEVDNGRWGQIYRDVFRIAGSPPCWEQGLTAAWLAAGRGAVVADTAAAAVHDLLPQGDFALITPPDRRVRVRNVRVRRTAVAGIDVQRVGRLLVTTPTLTALDLCALLDLDALVDVFDAMFTRRLSSPAFARRRLDQWASRGRPGATRARIVLSRYPDGERTPAPGRERRLLRLLAPLGVPLVPQYAVRWLDGTTVHADVGIPSHGAVVELQSYRWHAGLKAHARDVSRLAEYSACGLIAIPLTSWDVDHRPAWVLDRVARSCGIGR